MPGDQDTMKIYEVNTNNGARNNSTKSNKKHGSTLKDGAGGRITFLDKNKGFILESDKTGWNHLYLHNMDGSLKNAITSGNFTVLDVKLIDEKNSVIYFTAT